jgi:hypothetical protein
MSIDTPRKDAGTEYERLAIEELRRWQQEMLRRPGVLNQAARAMQQRVNALIPEKFHAAVTTVIRQMTRAVLTGSNFTAVLPMPQGALDEREQRVREKIDFYRKTAAAEGGITGAGGFLFSLADFPLLLSIKIKLLFDVAALYGYSGTDYRERMYLLFVLQLAFSSDEHRAQVYSRMVNWREQREQLPASLDDFDWRTFQQEYRDYLDLAKLAQMLPIIGAPVGVVVNNRLLKKLGHTAINAYRMRWFEERLPLPDEAVSTTTAPSSG